MYYFMFKKLSLAIRTRNKEEEIVRFFFFAHFSQCDWITAENQFVNFMLLILSLATDRISDFLDFSMTSHISTFAFKSTKATQRD